MEWNKRKSLIIDTGFFLALNQKNDSLHEKAKALAIEYHAYEWITTWPVITELFHLLSPHFAQRLLNDHQKGLFRIFSLDEHHVARLLQLAKKYEDSDIDLADISLVILAEFLEHGSILSCDQRDFSILRWGKNRAFHNFMA